MPIYPQAYWLFVNFSWQRMGIAVELWNVYDAAGIRVKPVLFTHKSLHNMVKVTITRAIGVRVIANVEGRKAFNF